MRSYVQYVWFGLGLVDELTWNDENIIVSCFQLSQVSDLSSSNACTFFHHVPLVCRRFSLTVVHYMHHLSIGGKHLDLQCIRKPYKTPHLFTFRSFQHALLLVEFRYDVDVLCNKKLMQMTASSQE